jgi:hypothetical protein
VAQLLLRRIRGVAVSMVLWAVPWALLFVCFATAIRNVYPIEMYTGERGLLFFAGVGASIGALNGLLFAILLMIGERRRGLDAVRGWRVGLWAALSTLAVVWDTGSFAPWLPAACTALGFGAGVGMLRLARHASPRSVPASNDLEG